MPLDRKIRYGMVGGGPGAFIGAVHRMAAALDGEMELVAGAFSSDPKKSAQQGKDLFLDPVRVYGSYQEMAASERTLDADERIDVVAIVTPNNSHYDIALTFLDAGFHVICDKPLVLEVEEAENLCKKVKDTGLVFALTHNYTGYPMVKQARYMTRNGGLGTLRKVVVEYPQGWLATRLEETGMRQASWRTNPAIAGVSSCMGDIGTHAENLVEYITGARLTAVCADLTTFVDGRPLDDDGNVLVAYDNGMRGVLYASQISSGEENGLRIRLYGTEGGLEWRQENPNYLFVKYPDRPEEIYKRGNDYLCEAAQYASRLPSGHPEAFIEAFANIYRNAARTIAAAITGEEPDPLDTDFPTVQDGAVGVHFIHTVVESSRARGWVDARYSVPM